MRKNHDFRIVISLMLAAGFCGCGDDASNASGGSNNGSSAEPVSAYCGDGIQGEGEECDGNDFDTSLKVCGDGLEEKASAVWICTDKCKIDASQACQGVCGNGKLDAGEECDGSQFDIGLKSCGTDKVEVNANGWVCTSACKIDSSNACALESCGNGSLDDGEACDGTLYDETAKKCPDGQEEKSQANWSCSNTCHVVTANACQDICGNGKLDEGEECDGSLFDESKVTCGEKQEMTASSTWMCSGACTIVKENACQDLCGNGKLDDGEACDDSQFAADAKVCPDGVAELEGASWGCSSLCEVITENACEAGANSGGKDEYDSDGCQIIDLSSPSSSNSNVTVNTETAGELVIKVKANVCTHLTGTFDGMVKLKNPNNIDLNVKLDNVTIKSDSYHGQLKFNSSALCKGNTYNVELIGANTITGAAHEDSKNVLKSESNLTISGSGNLTVNAKYKTGIKVDDVFTMNGGTVNVNLTRSSSNNENGFGAKIVNGFVMNGGTLKITANDNMSCYEARGLKVEGFDAVASTDEDYDEWNTNDCKGYGAGKGFVKINGGNIVISSDAKALFAGWDVSEDAVTSSTSDDPLPDVTINGGSISLTTRATPRDSQGGGHGGPGGPGGPGGSSNNCGSDNTLAPEGIEGKHGVYINNGEIIITATDDSINASSKNKSELEINGGKIYALSSNNDAIDSNGTFNITGGLVAAFGASGAEHSLDVIEGGKIYFSGGTIFGLAANSETPSATKGSFIVTSVSSPAGKTFALTESNSTTALAALKVPSSYSSGTKLMILQSALSSGTSYDLYTNATVTPASGSSWFNDTILDGTGTVSGSNPTSVTGGKSSGSGGPGGPGGPGGH